MRYESYDDAAKVAASGKKVFRIDVVLFNFVTENDGSESLDGEYYEKDGDAHPYECFFDNYWGALGHVVSFTEEMACQALSDNTNGRTFENVSVELNELDEDMNPGYVIAYAEWIGGTERNIWVMVDSDGLLEMA